MSYLKFSLYSKGAIEKLNQIGKKVLLIVGDEDHCFIRGSKKLVKKIKGSTIKIIKHCGHVCSIEQSSIFNKYALNYLNN